MVFKYFLRKCISFKELWLIYKI